MKQHNIIKVVLLIFLLHNIFNTLSYAQTVDDLHPWVNNAVNAVVTQPDGRVLVGGNFTTLNGQPRPGIGRLNKDGTLDTTFDPGHIHGDNGSNWVGKIIVQPDGRIYLIGSYHNIWGLLFSYFDRVNYDGTLDDTFKLKRDGAIHCLALQPDGKLLIGGMFTNIWNVGKTNIARLNCDGSLDTTFNAWTTYTPQFTSVDSIVLQPDGKVLITGLFNEINDRPSVNIGRLNSDGSLDTTFTNPLVIQFNQPMCLVVQPDGHILLGGCELPYLTQLSSDIVRLNENGSQDTSFKGYTSHDWVSSFNLQTDGKIIVGGEFDRLSGEPCNNFGRLNSDGSFDSTFKVNAQAGTTIKPGSIQADGSITVGGSFNELGGEQRTNFARLNNTGLATQSLDFDGTNITWLRGGTSPELSWSTFEICTNGIDWLNLGTGNRIPGGWQISGIDFPMSTTIRARGVFTGGFQNSSSGSVESIIEKRPVIMTQPVIQFGGSKSAPYLNNMVVSVTAIGAKPVNYQWYLGKYGDVSRPVTGSTNASFSTSPTNNTDQYWVRISNTYGQVDSMPAAINRLGLLPVSALAVATDSNLIWYEDGQYHDLKFYTHVETTSSILFQTITNTSQAYDGMDCLYSQIYAAYGTVHSYWGTVWLSTCIDHPGTISFWWKRDCPSKYGSFLFSIDSIYQESPWKEVGTNWSRATYKIGDGIHELKWENDAMYDSTDFGWGKSYTSKAYIDQVEFIPDTYGPPLITQHPQNQTNFIGSDIAFTVVAEGTYPLSYQWQLNGTNIENSKRISGAFSNTLYMTNIQPEDLGYYTVVITNALGRITSSAAGLSVISILTHPENQTNIYGATSVFSVTTSVATSLAYQWRRNGVALTNNTHVFGTDTSVLIVSNVFGGDSGIYSVVISNGPAAWASEGATLNVRDPYITTQPVSQNKHTGDTTSFIAEVTGSIPLLYQWKKMGV
jgi:uncharacterized delta-60 repeat protein